MMKQLAYTSQTCGGGKIEEPEVLVWASGHQLAPSAWLAGGVVLNSYNSWLLLFYLSGTGSTRPCKHIHEVPRRVWDPSLWGWVPSHQYSTLALVFVLWWGFPPKELAGEVLSETRLFYQLLCAPDTGKASPRDSSTILKSNNLCCYWTLQGDSELFRAAQRKRLP